MKMNGVTVVMILIFIKLNSNQYKYKVGPQYGLGRDEVIVATPREYRYKQTLDPENGSEQNPESRSETSSYENQSYGCSIFSFDSLSSALLFSIIILYMLMEKRENILEPKI